MQDKQLKKAPVLPNTVDILGVTLTMPMLALGLFALAVLLSKPACEAYSKKFCVIPRWLPKFN